VTEPIRLGTRASILARTQSGLVGGAIADRSARDWIEVTITTIGDDTTKPLNQPQAAGLFVSALRDALRDGRVDVIVHSFKDMPSAPVRGIVLGAVPPREDPRDALISRGSLKLADLPIGARIGTSSPRRAAAILSRRPDAVIAPIRGNVDSRIRQVREGRFDATILAVAGLRRIGREVEIAEVFTVHDMLPAPAQGALAVECRADDADMIELLGLIDDPCARLVTAAEREILVGIDAACTSAVASLATFADGVLDLRAELTDEYGISHAIARRTERLDVGDIEAARALGLRTAGDLLGATRAPPALLIRSDGNDHDLQELARLGIGAVSDQYVQIAAVPAPGLLDALSRHTWLVVSSPMTIPSWAASAGEAALRAAFAGVQAAATGERSASTLRELGCTNVVIPAVSSAQGLVDALSHLVPASAVFPRGDHALRTIPEGLRALGWQVTEGTVYETSTVDHIPASVELIRRRDVAAIVLRSPSAVRALTSFITPDQSIPIICGGSTTAHAATARGLTVAAIATSPDSAAIASAVSLAMKRA